MVKLAQWSTVIRPQTGVLYVWIYDQFCLEKTVNHIYMISCACIIMFLLPKMQTQPCNQNIYCLSNSKNEDCNFHSKMLPPLHNPDRSRGVYARSNSPLYRTLWSVATQSSERERHHGCQMAIAVFLDCIHFALWAWRTMAPLHCKIWSLPFLGLRQGGGRGG